MTEIKPRPSEPRPEVRSGLSGARRRMLYAGVAGAAMLAGVGIFRWRDNASTGPEQDTSAVWDLSFDTLGPSAFKMRSLAGKPLLLNFWATWCAPCVEELPLLNRFYEDNKHNGWQVVGLAVDQSAAVGAFLRHAPVSFPIALAGMPGIELSKKLGNLAGGLPFTVVFGSAGVALHRKMGRVSAAELQQWSALQ